MDHAAVDAIRRMAGLATPMTLRVAVTLGLSGQRCVLEFELRPQAPT
jgi:hypothetical protein